MNDSRPDCLDYSADSEDCTPCLGLGDLCPYHRGASDALQWVAGCFQALAVDVDLLGRIPVLVDEPVPASEDAREQREDAHGS